jgi:ATP-binding cassette subfamily C protein
LEIHRGDAVAFVGPSGAGKTTAVDIILGLIAPTAGRMTIDGIDVLSNIRSWQDRIGFVPQSIYLIDDTLRRNIALGVPDDEVDEQAIRSALGLAQLDTVVTDLPDGLDTLVGENGIRLSGGQRQRIGIARALYHDPDVLVLDEATSSMDAETEHEISNAIGVLAGIKTIIIIAHRMSTVKKCRKLFFLKHGRLVDTGTFEQLSSRNGDFQRMVEPDHREAAEIS